MTDEVSVRTLEAWLRTRPAVWEALQEGWEPGAGDWVTLTHKGERELNCLGTMDDSMDWAAWVKDSLDYRIILWLPSLGQLVRMLVEQTAAGQLYFNMPAQVEQQVGMYSSVAFRRDRSLIHYPLREGEKLYDYESVGETPEIACVALWAKVKGLTL